MSEPTVFGGYANFYDALYAEKDYDSEVDYLARVFAAHGVPAGGGILDLGCGTGSHDIPLALRGFTVQGVDRSREMVSVAEEKARKAGVEIAFSVGDACGFEIPRTFDAVISMFAVVSYQHSNAALGGILRTARHHLEPGGIFVFDAWFGPAVLTQRPEVRTVSVEDVAGDTVTRTAVPVLDVVKQTVEVSYEVTRSRDGQVLERVEESHVMRFLFAQEIAYFLECAGFEMVSIAPFMGPDRAPTVDDWNVSIVARAT